jgi:hypothetical protein
VDEAFLDREAVDTLSQHSPGSGTFGTRIAPLNDLGNGNSPSPRAKEMEPAIDGALSLNEPALLSSRRTSAVAVCRI